MIADRRRLVIVGDGEFAEIAFEYFTHDSEREVVGFAVERPFRQRDELFGLPVVAFDELASHFPPEQHAAFVAVTATKLNRVRARLCRQTKAYGYELASYVSSHAFVWHNVRIGENCFVFENNVIQYHVVVGDRVVLWSGNHVGHRTRIDDDCFLTSHVVVSGYCEIGARSFLGVNSSIADHRRIGCDCVIGAGAVVLRDTEDGRVYVGNPAKPLDKSSFDTFGVPAAER